MHKLYVAAVWRGLKLLSCTSSVHTVLALTTPTSNGNSYTAVAPQFENKQRELPRSFSTTCSDQSFLMTVWQKLYLLPSLFLKTSSNLTFLLGQIPTWALRWGCLRWGSSFLELRGTPTSARCEARGPSSWRKLPLWWWPRHLERAPPDRNPTRHRIQREDLSGYSKEMGKELIRGKKINQEQSLNNWMFCPLVHVISDSVGLDLNVLLWCLL